jgi:hypothetical protein
VTIFVAFTLFLGNFFSLKVEVWIEHSLSKHCSQNDEHFPPKKSIIGVCLYAGLGDVQTTLRNKIMVEE